MYYSPPLIATYDEKKQNDLFYYRKNRFCFRFAGHHQDSTYRGMSFSTGLYIKINKQLSVDIEVYPMYFHSDSLTVHSVDSFRQCQHLYFSYKHKNPPP